MGTKLEIGLGVSVVIVALILIWFNFINLPTDSIRPLGNENSTQDSIQYAKNLGISDEIINKSLVLDNLTPDLFRMPEVYAMEASFENISQFIELVERIKNKDYDAARWVLETGLFMEDKSISETEKQFIDIVQNKPDLLRILVSKNVIDRIDHKDFDWGKDFNPQKGEYSYLTDDLYNLPDIKDGINEKEKEAMNEFKEFIESSKTDYELRKGLYLIDEYGIPDQSMFKYDIPDYNTQLQVLLYLLEDRNVPEEYKRIALATAIDYGAVITIGDEKVKQQVRKYVPETIDFIIETDEIIKDNGADWQAKNYPLEADIGLVWGAGGTMLPIPYETKEVCSWENTFRNRQMSMGDFKWSFVSANTLKEMRDFMINKGYADENIEKYIYGGYKGNFFHPNREKSYEPLIIDGKKVLIKHNTNPNWQWEHYKKEGSFLGICVDRALVEKTLGKSINIDGIMGHIFIPGEDYIHTHTFALFYDQDNDALKTVSYELNSIKATVNDDDSKDADNYYYGHVHIPWDNLRNKYPWDNFNQEKVLEDSSSVSTIPVEGIPHGYIWRKALNFTKVTQPISKNNSTDISKSSETQLDVANISNFTEVVNKLDTPEKLLAYMKENFKFKFHEGHISYLPEEFFHKKEGDCKDLAKFGSYVLKQHGYDVKIMCLKLSGELKGQHVITLFYDKDRKLKYITNNAKNLELIKAESLDEILSQESKRLGCEITKYGFIPAGSTYAWVDNL